jgi:hypothetical protein
MPSPFPHPSLPHVCDPVAVHPLSWGDAGAATALLSLCQLPGGFDVVIGVDLMYYR